MDTCSTRICSGGHCKKYEDNLSQHKNCMDLLYKTFASSPVILFGTMGTPENPNGLSCCHSQQQNKDITSAHTDYYIKILSGRSRVLVRKCRILCLQLPALIPGSPQQQLTSHSIPEPSPTRHS